METKKKIIEEVRENWEAENGCLDWKYIEEAFLKQKEEIKNAIDKISEETNECGFGNEHINKLELLKVIEENDEKQ